MKITLNIPDEMINPHSKMTVDDIAKMMSEHGSDTDDEHKIVTVAINMIWDNHIKPAISANRPSTPTDCPELGTASSFKSDNEKNGSNKGENIVKTLCDLLASKDMSDIERLLCIFVASNVMGCILLPEFVNTLGKHAVLTYKNMMTIEEISRRKNDSEKKNNDMSYI